MHCSACTYCAFFLQVGRKREHLVAENKRLEELADQVDVVRSTLSKAASEMATTRTQCGELVGDIDTRKARRHMDPTPPNQTPSTATTNT